MKIPNLDNFNIILINQIRNQEEDLENEILQPL